MDSLTYIKRRLNATHRTLMLVELSHIELACNVKTIKSLTHNEAMDLCNLIDSTKKDGWTISNRHADNLILKVKKYCKKH